LKPLEQAVSMTFHTDIDVSDMLTMFTQSVPLEGGDQYIASIASIYNNLATKDPEVIQTLAADWYWERSFR
jgi:Taurine catabolism dioxygenase TauD, TfdA family